MTREEFLKYVQKQIHDEYCRTWWSDDEVYEFCLEISDLLFTEPTPFDPAKIEEMYEGVEKYYSDRLQAVYYTLGKYNIVISSSQISIKLLKPDRVHPSACSYIMLSSRPETFEQFEDDVFRATGIKLERRV